MSTSTTAGRDSRSRPQASSSSTAAAAAAKPPIQIQPTTHLDPSAYVQGPHPISLGAWSIVHPRARLVSAHGPLIIGDGVVISERCVVGGPAPDPKDVLGAANILSSVDPVKTVIGENVMMHPAAEVQAGAALGDACVVEANSTILKGVKVGAHSKICAGSTVDRDVRDWEVVYGHGQLRRQRVPVHEVEAGRLKALEREREATVAIMRAASKATQLKKRG